MHIFFIIYYCRRYDGPFFKIAPPPHWKVVKRGPVANTVKLICFSQSIGHQLKLKRSSSEELCKSQLRFSIKVSY